MRAKISGTAERPRLAVFRSSKNIYAQLIDDVAGTTLVAAASNEKDFGIYGGKGNINLEELMAAQPQVVIDVGEPRGDIVADLNALQEQT